MAGVRSTLVTFERIRIRARSFVRAAATSRSRARASAGLPLGAGPVRGNRHSAITADPELIVTSSGSGVGVSCQLLG
jgi:hypothetical protein